jgi:hypothetical protein
MPRQAASVFCLVALGVVVLSSATLSTTRARAGSGLKGLGVMSPTAASAALRALDTDGSGKVEKNEVEAFARQQGLSAEQVGKEFGELDVNGDGELEAEEILGIAKAQPQQHALPEQQAQSQTQPKNLAQPQQFAQPQAQPQAPPQKQPQQNAQFAEMASPAPAAIAASTSSVSSSYPASKAEDLLQTATLGEFQMEAGRALTEVFASSANAAFEQQKKVHEQVAQNATALEERARSLRGQAKLLASTAAKEATHAASKAAEKVLAGATMKVRELEQKATNMESIAAAKREQAHQAMVQVATAEDVLSAAMLAK